MIKTYYVYLHLRRDTEEVFYVGCATRHLQREGRRAQYSRAYDIRQRQPEWFAICAAAGGVCVEIGKEFFDRAEAFAEEIKLIAQYGRADRGAGPLVNHTDGGDGMPGFKDTPESRRLKSVTKIGELNPMYGKQGPRARKVVDKATGTEYPSVEVAAKAIGCKMKTLYNWLSGHRPNPTQLEFM